ncbi:MAG: hypothetical protein R2705_09780 [Ilumatobacteraceae bacterium]
MHSSLAGWVRQDVVVRADLVINPVDATWSQIVFRDADRGSSAAWPVSGCWTMLRPASSAGRGWASASRCSAPLAVAFPHVELGPLVLDAAARPVAVSIAG